MADEEVSSLWEQQRIFRAGIARKSIHFVPAAATSKRAIQLAPQTTPSISPQDRYLNIVLKNGTAMKDHTPSPIGVPYHEGGATRQQLDLEGAFCEICNLPVDTSKNTTSTASTNHESTIAHMVCLSHSHPPSHLDRRRQGLKYLSSYGWDPDSRKGLGATGEGVRAPIKAKVKNDTVGLGVKTKGSKKPTDTKVVEMDAKQVRRMDIEDRRKRERLQEMFYGNGDVEKHLGGE